MSPESGSREPVTWLDVVSIRQRHRDVGGLCASWRCNNQTWPCDAGELLTWLDVEAEAAISALRSPADTGEHQEGDVGS